MVTESSVFVLVELSRPRLEPENSQMSANQLSITALEHWETQPRVKSQSFNARNIYKNIAKVI